MNHYRLHRAMAVGAVLFSASLSGVSPVTATEYRTGDVVHITGGEILDDFFAAGGDINLEADVLGDFIAFGRTIIVGDDATVDNSVMCGGRRVDINGHVRNSVRICGQYVTVRGHIERNLMCFAQSVIVDGSAWIEKDISFMAGEVLIRGRVGGDLKGSGETVTISGQIDGDVDVEADRIVVQSTAIIGGRLTYRSKQDATIEEGAQILGSVDRLEPETPGGYSLGDFVWDAWWFLATFAVGALALLIFRPFLQRMVVAMRTSSLKTLLLGFLFFVCLPIAAVILAFTLVGIPIAVFTIMGWVALLYLSQIFVGLTVGQMILGQARASRPAGPYLALFVGLVIVTLVMSIPWVGVAAKAVMFSGGIGGFILTIYNRKIPDAVL